MTADKVREAFAACRSLLPNATTAKRGSELWQQHIVFMCEEGARIALAQPDKAMRWLGFVQGTLWVHGLASIDHFKDMNRAEKK